MPRKTNDFIDYGIEEDIDPRLKFNSLISVAVSTLMCLAAKCPLPKSNIETTKLFLSTITDDNEEPPRNIKDFLTLLNDYSGPYESDLQKETNFEKPPAVKEKNKTSSECESAAKASLSQVITRDGSTVVENDPGTKRFTKTNSRKSEKDSKKTIKSVGSRISPSKSMISKL